MNKITDNPDDKRTENNHSLDQPCKIVADR